MSAIEASTVSVKTMADDTLRLTVDIEPRFAQQAFALFGQRGRPLALAALLTAAEHPQEADKSGQQGEAKRLPVPKEGLRSVRAWKLCNDESFQRWSETIDSLGAAIYIRSLCGIDSRSELDTSQPAADAFDLMCVDFRDWMEARR